MAQKRLMLESHKQKHTHTRIKRGDRDTCGGNVLALINEIDKRERKKK